MAKESKKKKQNILKKCLKAPFQALIKARDCYIKGMMGCAGKFGNPSPGGPRRSTSYNLPKSYSTSSSMTNVDDEYIREMIRAASTKILRDKLELEQLRAEVLGPKKGGDEVVPRSQSVATFARIDENAPCDFGDDVRVNVDLVPRSRSHAIPKNRARFV